MSDPERHLAAAGADDDLRGKSVRSAALQMVGQVAQIALMVGSGMALARLLTPRDFGVVAMVTAVSTFFLRFRDFGFNLAAVQREQLNHEQASALFWTHLRLTIGAAAIVAAMAPVLAWFFGERAVIPVTLAMAAGVLLMGVGTLPEGVLLRRMRVNVVVLAEVVGMLLSVIVAIAAALLGAGLWALVLQFVTLGAVRSAVLWSRCGWKPSRPASVSGESREGYQALLGFGGRYTAARVVEYVGRHVDSVLVGYMSGATVLGLYESAARWSYYPVLHLQIPLTRVAVAGLSRLQHDDARFVEACRRGLLPVFALIIPLLAFMAVAARDVILLLLGDQWLGAVPLFRMLAIGAMAASIARVTMWVYLARGDTRRQLTWSLVHTPLVVLAVALGTRWGAEGVAIAFAGANWLLLYPGLAYCLAGSPLSPARYLAIVARPLFASAIAAVAVVLLQPRLDAVDALIARLALALGVFVAAYLVAWVLIPGGRRAMAEVHGLTKLLRLERAQHSAV